MSRCPRCSMRAVFIDRVGDSVCLMCGTLTESLSPAAMAELKAEASRRKAWTRTPGGQS